MFFSWHPRNRQFKKNRGRLGQAFVILLICIAGFVVAKYLTKITGESNIAQTAASNGADSGSLSAASCWAGSLNRLVYRNWDKDSLEKPFGFGHTGKYMGYTGGDYYYYKEMNLYYKQMRELYLQVYLDSAKYINEAHAHALEALRLLVTIQPRLVDGAYCETWEPYKQISTDFTLAADTLQIAAYAVGAFHVDTFYEAAISHMFKFGRGQEFTIPRYPGDPVGTQEYYGTGTGQVGSLCAAMGLMEENYNNAITTGQYYAINNSGYNAPDADAFSFWLGGGVRGGSFNPGANTGVADNTVSYPPGGGGVTATIKTPNISEYEIKMAKWNYPKKHGFKSVPFPCIGLDSGEHAGDVWGYASSYYLSDDLRKIVGYLRQCADLAQKVYDITKSASENCCECVNDENDDDDAQCKPPCAPSKYVDASSKVAELKMYTDCFVAGLGKIVHDASGGEGEMGPDTIPRLQNWNNWIMANFWVAPEAGILKSAKDCKAVMDYCDANCDAPSMQIININKVTLTGEWKAFCDLNTTAARKTSKSKFWGQTSQGKGENIGQNWSPPEYPDYYPEITDN